MKLLNANTYVTSKSLAFALNTSDKTIRKYISILKYDLEQHGASLDVKQGTGIKLEVRDRALFQQYISSTNEEVSYNDPTTRRIYVLFRLITEEDYVDLYTLAEELYISPSLLRSIIKSLSEYTTRYHLTLLHSHNHGYRITGDESNIRQCLADESREVGSLNTVLFHNRFYEDQTTKISSIIAKVLQKYAIVLSDEGIRSLTLHIMIAVNRTELKNPIKLDHDLATTRIRTSPEFFVATNILSEVKDIFHVELPEDEQIYLAMHISGKQRVLGHEQLHVRVQEDTIVFYNKFLRSVHKLSGVDFFEDNELRVSMYNHIVPFLQRLNANMQIYRSELANVKDDFPYAYELAVYGLSFVKDKIITEAETSYFALHLALSLEKQKINAMHKVNVAVVCDRVDSFYQLVSFQLSHQFSEYIQTIQYVKLSEIQEMQSQFQLFLNMTNKELPVPSKVIDISSSLTDEELNQIETTLKKMIKNPEDTSNFQHLHYKRYTNSISKEDLIYDMVSHMQEIYHLPENYYDLVMKRETMNSTEYSNRIAIPHALIANQNIMFVSIAILEKPILWNTKQVQIAFLISLPKKSVTWFMSLISKAIHNEEIAQSLIDAEDIDSFQRIFLSL